MILPNVLVIDLNVAIIHKDIVFINMVNQSNRINFTNYSTLTWILHYTNWVLVYHSDIAYAPASSKQVTLHTFEDIDYVELTKYNCI